MQPLTYGFVGLGHLGGKLAASLRRADVPLLVYDLNPDLAHPLLAAGARWGDSPAAIAAEADALITCLPSPAATRAVLTGAGGALPAGPGTRLSAWIEMSTNDRDEILELGALAAQHGVATLEAPVTGGVHRAAAGEITILAGGDEALYRRHLPALQAMGGEVMRVGELGAASVLKVITNMLAFINLIGVGEALMLAKRGGVDLATAFHGIRASSGNSFVHETESQVILNGSYNINFTMDLAIKDLGFALAYGKTFGVPLDLAGMAMQTFIRARSAYGGEAWSSMVVKLLEDVTGTDLRAPGFPAELEPA